MSAKAALCTPPVFLNKSDWRSNSAMAAFTVAAATCMSDSGRAATGAPAGARPGRLPNGTMTHPSPVRRPRGRVSTSTRPPSKSTSIDTTSSISTIAPSKNRRPRPPGLRHPTESRCRERSGDRPRTPRCSLPARRSRAARRTARRRNAPRATPHARSLAIGKPP